MAGINVSWSFNLAIDGGPRISTAQPPIEVTGYDYVRGLIPKNTGTPGEVALDVQPTAATSGSGAKVVFLAITGQKYGPLAYSPTASQGTADKHKLDGPLVLIGQGAVSLMGTSAPTKLYFENSSTTDDLYVEILVGRKAA